MIREVRPGDVAAVIALVHELAEYEREPQSCHLTAEQLTAALFGPAEAEDGRVSLRAAAAYSSAGSRPFSPALFGHVAEVEGEVVGCALWFLNFSTWRGAHGIFLEDLYVRPEHRGTGIGRALLADLAAVCVERGYGRLEWSVLDWNAPSIAFYRSLGAAGMDEWTNFRLEGPALDALGAGDAPAAMSKPPRTTPGPPR